MVKPLKSKALRAQRAIGLLEKHHSQPYLAKARKALVSCGMSWQGGQWRNYWKGAGRGQRKQRKEDKGKGGSKTKESIPQYDADCWESAPSSSSSRTPDHVNPGLQDLTKILQTVVQAGGIELPPEAKQILEATAAEENRSTFTSEQRQLNARRKAFNKVQKLKEALTKKHEKFKMFRQALKEQLNVETERYDKDVTEIKDKIKQAESELARIEAGETVGEPNQEIIEVDDDFFHSMEQVKEKSKLQAALAESKANNLEMESKYMAAHKQMQEMQNQMNFLMNQIQPGGAALAALTCTPPPSQEIAAKLGESPQLPKPTTPVGPFQRMNTPRIKERSGPYGESAQPPANPDNVFNAME